MAELIRSFVAIEIPETLKNQISEYTGNLKARNKNIRWVRENNLHLTLKFIGEQTPEMTDAIIARLIPINSGNSKFTLSTADTGAFPNSRRPRVIWLGIKSEPDQALISLQSKIEENLSPLLPDSNKKRFSPHLTLGRVKFEENFGVLFNYMNSYPFPAIAFKVNRFVLMQSLLKPSGAQYSIIQKYPLQNT